MMLTHLKMKANKQLHPSFWKSYCSLRQLVLCLRTVAEISAAG